MAATKARMVRDGVKDVARVLGVQAEYARQLLANLLGVSANQVAQWGERGIQKERTWAAWCEAVEETIRARTGGGASDDNKFASLVRVWRVELGMTQERLAAKLGVIRQTVCRWERLEAVPKRKTRERVLWILLRLRKKAG